jgi:predicted N-formylglutamate amidohydrolase
MRAMSAGVPFEADPGDLLGPGDPPPVEIVNPAGRGRALLIADHAGRAIPRRLGRLGLDEATLARHIAWDIGIESTTGALSALLDAPAAIAHYSRLVIDCNRRLDDPTSIAQVSDNVDVPGNRGLTPAARQSRAAACFHPYHRAIDDLVAARRGAGAPTALISMHSFTPVIDGFERPWHVGVLWHRDTRLPRPLLARLAADPALVVGDNQPYSGRDERGYSTQTHGEGHGLPHVLIELRQDLIDTPPGAAAWAERLAAILGAILADEALYRQAQP